MKRQTIILIAVIALLSSCFDDGDCISTTTDVLSISFKKYISNEIDTVEINEITMIGTDSVFYPLVAATGITLPLDPNVNSFILFFLLGNLYIFAFKICIL